MITRGKSGWVAAVIGLALAGGVLGAEWQALGGAAGGREPSVTAVKADAEGVRLNVTVPGFETELARKGGGDYAVLELPGCGITETVGAPQLPVIRRLLVAPDGARVTAAATGGRAAVARASFKGTKPPPVLPRQRPVPKVPGALEKAPFDRDAAVYAADAAWPAETVRVVEAGRYAGRRLVLVEIFPLAFNPARGQLEAAAGLEIEVRFDGSAKAAPAEPLPASAAAAFDGLLLNGTFAGAKAGAGHLLVIGPSALVSNLGTFAAHKSNLNWTVSILATNGTTTGIRSAIQARYANLATRPDAVLLVGDIAQVPRFVASTEDNPDTDIYYGCMDAGDDWVPEVPVGRLSVTDAAGLAAVVAKWIEYDTAAPGEWLLRAAFMAGDDNHAITEATHNAVIATYLNPLGFTSDKLYGSTYGATTPQVSAAFNNGRVLGIYSGHGSETAWADGPPFSQANVNALTNAARYPFVCSFACLTGMFSVNECFAETWQRAPGKGSVAIMASSVYSYWNEDDILEKRLFQAIYGEGLSGFGAAILRAKALYLAYYGATATTRRYFEMYNLFGDPGAGLRGRPLMAGSGALPAALAGQPYSAGLQAFGGRAPYTWTLTGGALPDGMTLTSGGLVTGLCAAVTSATFSARVTDADLAVTSAVYNLHVRLPLAILTDATLPPASNGTPYQAWVEATGGVPPYAWSRQSGAFEEAVISSGWLGATRSMGWRGDDASWALSLPWPFFFGGKARTSLWVCSNGYVDFESDAAEYSNSADGLRSRTRIAPLWDDLTTSAGDIHVTTNATYVAIRWQAVTYSGSYPANMELVLFRSGAIRFNYGPAHAGLSATVGVSAGAGQPNLLSRYNANSSIPAYSSVEISDSAGLPAGLMLSDQGEISGTPTAPGSKAFTLTATDGEQSASRTFSLLVQGEGSVNPGSSVTVVTDRATAYVPEGRFTNLQVRLSSQPTGSVTVTIARVGGDSDINVSFGGSQLFTVNNWDTWRDVRLSATEDNGDNANGSASIACRIVGLTTTLVEAVELDDDVVLEVDSPFGTVTRSPSTPFYEKGTQVTLTATPQTSYFFAGYTGGVVSAANPATFAIAGDTVVTVLYGPTAPAVLPPRSIGKTLFCPRWKWTEGGAPEGELEVSLLDGSAWTPVIGCAPCYTVNETGRTVSNLLANRTYSYRLRRLMPDGRAGPWSARMNVRTGTGMPAFKNLLPEARVTKGVIQTFPLTNLVAGAGTLKVQSSNLNAVKPTLTTGALQLQHLWTGATQATVTLTLTHPATGYKAVRKAVIRQAGGSMAVVGTSALTNDGILLAQEVMVENRTGGYVQGVRVRVKGLQNNAWLANMTGTDPALKVPMVELPCVLPPGSQTVVRLVYKGAYAAQAAVKPATCSACAVAPPLNGAPPARPECPSVFRKAYDGLWLSGIPAACNRSYGIQYSDDDGQSWVPEPDKVRCTANELLWLDLDEDAPAKRIYRAVDAGL